MDVHEVDALLDRHRDKFRRLLQTIAAEEEGEDPFRFPLDRYRTLSSEDRARLVRRAAILRAEAIERELRARGASWLVMAGDDVLTASASSADIPSPEDVLRMGEPRGLVAYLFEAPLIEELPHVSAWAPLDARDSYPTLPLVLHQEGSAPMSITADLDTGSHATFLDARDVKAPVVTWFTGRHLGDSFLWTAAAVEFELSTAGAGAVRKRFPVRVVHQWQSSPFVRIHSARKALVGRDLLRHFSIEVLLSARRSESEVVGATE